MINIDRHYGTEDLFAHGDGGGIFGNDHGWFNKVAFRLVPLAPGDDLIHRVLFCFLNIARDGGKCFLIDDGIDKVSEILNAAHFETLQVLE